MQISRLALYSFLAYDRLGIGPEGEGGPASDDYVAVLDMGADQSTVMVTNGAKIWIRNIPIGGNHFTRALTKEMKLTFAKAEHLKCNATKSPDPKSVFQALKPVFNDYLSEVQRSLGYFASVNSDGDIVKVIGCGNGFRMAGLQKFLEQNLDQPVERAESFNQLAGTQVLEAPLFRENIMSFTVAYGLALQGMGLSRVKTTLLPPEIAMAREIRRKKPWAAITAATLLVGLSLSTIGYANAWKTVNTKPWEESLKVSETLQSKWKGYVSAYGSADGRYNAAKEDGAKLVEGVKDTTWLEFYKALDECLPRDEGEALDETDIEKRNRIMIETVTAKKEEDLGSWYETLQASVTTPTEEIAKKLFGVESLPVPEGEGYLFTLTGEHYHHIEGKEGSDVGMNYLLKTILPDLLAWQKKKEDGTVVDIRRLGISYPVIVDFSEDVVELETRSKQIKKKAKYNVLDRKKIPLGGRPGQLPGGSIDPEMEMEMEMERGGTGLGRPGGLGLGGGYTPGGSTGPDRPRNENMEVKRVHRTTFAIQFVWKPTPVEEREELDPLNPNAEDGQQNSENGETAPGTQPGTD